MEKRRVTYAEKREFEKSCEYKKQFFSEKDCIRQMNNVINASGDTRLVPYECPYCGYWHFGHPKGSEKLPRGNTEIDSED